MRPEPGVRASQEEREGDCSRQAGQSRPKDWSRMSNKDWSGRGEAGGKYLGDNGGDGVLFLGCPVACAGDLVGPQRRKGITSCHHVYGMAVCSKTV